jgi:hypothetical protein
MTRTHRSLRLLALGTVIAILALANTARVYAAAPSNDDITNATVISALPFTTSEDISGATSSSTDLPPVCDSTNVTVWFTFTATETRWLDISASLGGYPPATIAVFSGSPGSLTQVACNQNQVTYVAQSGTTYYFMVQPAYGLPGGQLTFSADWGPAPPVNDDFANATIITGLPFSTTEDTTGATQAPDDPYCYGAGGTVWFQFTPTASARLEINLTASDYPARVSVFTGTRGNLSTVACGDTTEDLRFNAAAGTTYYFMFDNLYYGYNGGQLNFTVSLAPPPPPNDDFDNATVISTVPYSNTEDTSDATSAVDDPNCFTLPGSDPTVWYKFTPSQSLRYNINTNASSYPTAVSVYTGTRGNLSQLTCTFGSAQFSATAGQTYYIEVGSVAGAEGGTLVFSLDVAFNMQLALGSTGSVISRTGTATVSGSVTCTKANTVNVSGDLKQTIGRLIVHGSYSTSVPCSGDTSWKATVTGDNGLFAAGKATISATAQAVDPDTGAPVQTSASGTVTLIGRKS